MSYCAGGSLRLVWIWECAEYARWSTIVYQSFASSNTLGFECLNLWPVHTHHQKSSNKSTEDLADDVVWDFLPREPLPNGEAYRDGWIEMAARGWSTGDYGEGNPNGECPTNLN